MSVLEFRIALTAEHYEQVTAFYRQGLGLSVQDVWTDNGHGIVFQAGTATLEVLDPTHAASVDTLEVGEQVSGHIRFAFQVPNVHDAVERALKHGGKLVHAPTLTPWNHLNARITAPDGLQITLFQDIGTPP